MKHRGTLSVLKAAVADCGLAGAWSYREQNRYYVFYAESGEVVNWWPRTGTVNMQGVANVAMMARLEQMLSSWQPQSMVPRFVDGARA
jgi:hypothetical protein